MEFKQNWGCEQNEQCKFKSNKRTTITTFSYNYIIILYIYILLSWHNDDNDDDDDDDDEYTEDEISTKKILWKNKRKIK